MVAVGTESGTTQPMQNSEPPQVIDRIGSSGGYRVPETSGICPQRLSLFPCGPPLPGNHWRSAGKLHPRGDIRKQRRGFNRKAQQTLGHVATYKCD